ncbi:hypothetical protein GCM10023214_12070 [Amycolatopsis dongchuanensis]|uniref:Uncharacterized protein n=1 Tax=Amycolatopsis dongchuanensis TaxID=1070866 RepID=A0ABP9Q7E7_9PSEU
MSDDSIIDKLLETGLDDWVAVHDVVWNSTRGTINDESKDRTIRILGRLYSEGLMVPGDLGASGFEDWPSAPQDWISRSRSELDRFDWCPMGAGFWLRLTSYGKTKATRGHIDADETEL